MNALPAEQIMIEQRIAADYEAAQRLARDIQDRYAESVRSRIRISPQMNLRASSFGYKCDRRLYHDVADWQSKAPTPEAVQKFFDRGNDQEPLIERKLSQLGFRIIGSQVAFEDHDLHVTGHIDGTIVEDQYGKPLIAELKSTANASLLGCQTVEDLRGNKFGYRYLVQVTLYMRFSGIYAAVLILWSTQDWEPIVIPVPYDPEFSELLADRARRINEHIRRGEAPDYTTDSRECRQCPHYGRACSPPISFGAGAQIITDDELLEDLERHATLETAGREYTTLDRRIKERLKGDKADPQDALFIVGPFEVHRTVGARKGYVVQPSKTQKIEWERVA